MKFLNEVYTGVLSEEVIDENTGKKNLYIVGVFAEADTKNRNGRIYPRKVMERGVNEYINEYVKTNRSLGEINHPDRLSVDPKEASHKITELYWEGNKLMGKALVLNTPNGNILRGLLEGGVSTGISLRSAGSLKVNSAGINEVQDDWKLSCFDVVANPSFNAYMNPVMEEKEFIYDNGQFIEVTEDVLEKMGYVKAVEAEVKPEPKSKSKIDEEKLLKALSKLTETSHTPNDITQKLEHHSKEYNNHLKSVHAKASKLAGTSNTDTAHITLDEIRNHVKEMERHLGEMKSLRKYTK